MKLTGMGSSEYKSPLSQRVAAGSVATYCESEQRIFVNVDVAIPGTVENLKRSLTHGD